MTPSPKISLHFFMANLVTYEATLASIYSWAFIRSYSGEWLNRRFYQDIILNSPRKVVYSTFYILATIFLHRIFQNFVFTIFLLFLATFQKILVWNILALRTILECCGIPPQNISCAGRLTAFIQLPVYVRVC